MNMRTVHDRRAGNTCDPYRADGNAPLVDRMIGTAYDVVKYVARHLDVIRYVAANMENIYEVASNLKRSGVVLGETLTAGATASVAIPETITQSMILSSTVLVETATGDLFGADSGYFTASIQAGALRLALSSSAPAALENATIRWFITYGA